MLILAGSHRTAQRRGPHENGHRPSIDPLSRTAARAPPSVGLLGWVLSGFRWMMVRPALPQIKSSWRSGAGAEPRLDALFNGMPTSAIENVSVDFVGRSRR